MLATEPTPIPDPFPGPAQGPAGHWTQTSVRTRQARRRRRKLRGVVALTIVFLATMAALAWYVSGRSDNSIIAAGEPSEPIDVDAGDGQTKAGPGTVADVTSRSGVDGDVRSSALAGATTTEPAGPSSSDGDEAATTASTTAPRSPSTTARRRSTTTPSTAAPSSTVATTAPTTAPPTTAAPTTAETATTTEGTTTTIAGLTSGTPTPVGVQVSTGDGQPLADVIVVFSPGSPVSDGARTERVVTGDDGFAELTLLSGCYSIDFDARHSGELVNEPPKRRCFKPVGVQHLVALTGERIERPPASGCAFRQGEDARWYLTITQDDGRWALHYRALDESNNRVVIRDQTPVEATETSRTYAFDSYPFRTGLAVRLVAAHPSGSSVAIGCST